MLGGLGTTQRGPIEIAARVTAVIVVVGNDYPRPACVIGVQSEPFHTHVSPRTLCWLKTPAGPRFNLPNITTAPPPPHRGTEEQRRVGAALSMPTLSIFEQHRRAGPSFYQ